MKCGVCNGGGGGFGWHNRCETCKGRGYIIVPDKCDTDRLIQLSRQLAEDPTNVQLQNAVKALSERIG
jgi:RecJ-like exonuclease